MNTAKTMNIEKSILAPYVSDPNDDGTYVLHLSHEETMRLWEAVDAQTRELETLRELANDYDTRIRNSR